MMGKTIQSGELGRCAAALSLLALAAPAAAQSAKIIVYGESSTNIPRFRTSSGTSWSTETATLDVNASPRWAIAQKCPTRNEVLAAVGDSTNDLNLMIYDGSSWGHLIEVSTALVTSGDRPFFAAYEQASGGALVTYRVGGTDSTLFYRTWNGSAWSSQGSTTYWGTGNPKFVKLVPKAASDEIMVIILDNNSDLSATIWNGATFTNNILLDSNAAFSGVEEFDAAYETVSGRCLIAWSTSSTTAPQYRIWSGSSWLSQGALPDVGGSTKWLRLAPDSASNKIIAMTLDGGSDVNVVTWNGAGWGSVLEFETSAPNSDRRGIDVAFEPAGTRALAMYGRSSQDNFYYRTFDGASWSAAITGPAMSNPPSVIQLSPAGTGTDIFVAVLTKNDGALNVFRWNGTTIVDNALLNSNLAGPNTSECFMITGTGGTVPKRYVANWCEVEPN